MTDLDIAKPRRIAPDPGAIELDGEPSADAEARLRPSPRRTRRRDIFVWISIAWLVLLLALVIAQPILPLDDPLATDYSAVGVGPFETWDHPLGTDVIGRDMLARLISGAAVSLIVGVGAVSLATIGGLTSGLIAGYFSGRTGKVLGGVADVMLAFPSLVLLIAFAVFAGPGLATITVGIGIVGTPQVFRVSRATTLQFAQREFVLAAQGMGLPRWKILARELLPVAVVPVLSYALIMVAVAIIAEGGLSFLGLGVPPPQASWGSMIADGRSELQRSPHMVLIPAFVMFLTLMSLNFLGDYVGKRFDVKESSL